MCNGPSGGVSGAKSTYQNAPTPTYGGPDPRMTASPYANPYAGMPRNYASSAAFMGTQARDLQQATGGADPNMTANPYANPYAGMPRNYTDSAAFLGGPAADLQRALQGQPEMSKPYTVNQQMPQAISDPYRDYGGSMSVMGDNGDGSSMMGKAWGSGMERYGRPQGPNVDQWGIPNYRPRQFGGPTNPPPGPTTPGNPTNPIGRPPGQDPLPPSYGPGMPGNPGDAPVNKPNPDGTYPPPGTGTKPPGGPGTTQEKYGSLLAQNPGSFIDEYGIPRRAPETPFVPGMGQFGAYGQMPAGGFQGQVRNGGNYIGDTLYQSQGLNTGGPDFMNFLNYLNSYKR